MHINFFKKQEEEDEEFLRDLRGAYLELQSSQSFFENAKDPDLVDYAIFRLEAAKAKYSYFLRKAKEKGITSNGAFNA